MNLDEKDKKLMVLGLAYIPEDQSSNFSPVNLSPSIENESYAEHYFAFRIGDANTRGNAFYYLGGRTSPPFL